MLPDGAGAVVNPAVVVLDAMRPNLDVVPEFACLFVYSTNTPFEVTEESNSNVYTKFRAYAVLEHDGDMIAAARLLREVD